MKLQPGFTDGPFKAWVIPKQSDPVEVKDK